MIAGVETAVPNWQGAGQPCHVGCQGGPGELSRSRPVWIVDDGQQGRCGWWCCKKDIDRGEGVAAWVAGELQGWGSEAGLPGGGERGRGHRIMVLSEQQQQGSSMHVISHVLPIFLSDFISFKYFPIHMFNNSTFLVIMIGYMLICSLLRLVGFSQFFITKNILNGTDIAYFLRYYTKVLFRT